MTALHLVVAAISTQFLQRSCQKHRPDRAIPSKTKIPVLRLAQSHQVLQAERTTKLASCDVCCPSFESLHWPYNAEKEGRFVKLCETSSHLYNLNTGKKLKNGCVAEKAKWDFSHLCAPFAVQAQCSCFIITWHPISHLCAKLGAQDPSNNRNRCLENLDVAGASSNYAQKGLFIQKGLSCL